MATKKPARKGTSRARHPISSGKARAGEAGSGGSGRRPKPKPKPTPKVQPGKGEQHAMQRRRALELRKAADKVNYSNGLNAASIKNDGTLSAKEKKHLLGLLEKMKHEG